MDAAHPVDLLRADVAVVGKIPARGEVVDNVVVAVQTVQKPRGRVVVLGRVDRHAVIAEAGHAGRALLIETEGKLGQNLLQLRAAAAVGLMVAVGEEIGDGTLFQQIVQRAEQLALPAVAGDVAGERHRVRRFPVQKIVQQRPDALVAAVEAVQMQIRQLENTTMVASENQAGLVHENPPLRGQSKEVRKSIAASRSAGPWGWCAQPGLR